MRRAVAAIVVAVCLAATPSLMAAWGVASAAKGKGVEVVANEAERRVDVTIDGKPFTTYMWPTTLKKPVLYPLIDSDGVTVTRGYPLAPLAGERVDHPHHAGMWFNYGNANGFDFWNNSDAIKAEQRPKMGTVVHTRLVSTKSGPDKGELVVDSEWVTGAGNPILEQRTRYVFQRSAGQRVIDQIVTLKAIDKVVFNDDKEGVLGIRVARWLESPEEKGGIFTDANGNATKVDAPPGPPAGPNPATNPATGVYLTSEGVNGPAVWSTRGRWCLLTGHTPVAGQAGPHVDTIAIIDHPGNPGYPTYWHARGYGLFAANPLGRSIFDPKQPAFNYTLEKGQQTTFRYRVVIADRAENADELNKEADAFAAEYK